MNLLPNRQPGSPRTDTYDFPNTIAQTPRFPVTQTTYRILRPTAPLLVLASTEHPRLLVHSFFMARCLLSRWEPCRSLTLFQHNSPESAFLPDTEVLFRYFTFSIITSFPLTYLSLFLSCFVETILCPVFHSVIKLILTRGFDWFKLECFLDYFFLGWKEEIFSAASVYREWLLEG